LKLGIEISETSVAKYMVRHRKPPSPSRRTFLDNHIHSLVSVDYFTVPTIRFQVLYVFLVLAHDRRRVVHFNVTAHPTAEWTAQQLLSAPRSPWQRATCGLRSDGWRPARRAARRAATLSRGTVDCLRAGACQSDELRAVPGVIRDH